MEPVGSTDITTPSAPPWQRPFARIDIASLVYFRIAFGAILLWEVWRYFDHDWIRRYWIEPSFHFTYYGFGWARPWPADGMYIHFVALGALAVLIILGLWYRLGAILFFLGFTYMFLLEQARYLNHFYMVALVSFLMIFMPANRAFAIDALRRPQIRSDTAPAWTIWLLRFQIGLVFFFGGIAKLNPDWLAGEPVRMWLADRADYPFIGPFVAEEWMVYRFVIGGILIDLFIAPALLWRRTRPFAFIVAIIFNLTNAWIFQIGIFPWMMIAAALIFFSPDWPRRIFGVLFQRSRAARPKTGPPILPVALGSREILTITLLGLYVAVQLLVPFRHFLYPGNPSWTEEGHRFAWHMKLRNKNSRATFFVTDPTTNLDRTVDPTEYLTRWQARKMAGRPDMILQFAHHLARQAREEGHQNAQVRAQVRTSLNGRERQLLIDPDVDLAAQPRTLKPAPWILPLTEPLREPSTDPAPQGE